MNQRKIILVGFRATGKSSVGRLLAAHLGVGFLDMDQVLTERYGEIREQVAAHGWEYFRARERELLAELAEMEAGVIATGGGAVLHRELWPPLKKNALVVWLTSTLELICRRLSVDPATGAQRPSLTGGDIRAETAKVLAEREPLYREVADLTVDSNRPVPEVVAEIEGLLAKTAGP